MSDLVEYTFSFQDLLSPEQTTNQRWIEIMEVLDQLFEEFVYPELERTKNLKSIYTAEEEDLDDIFADKYYYLYESIQEAATTKRVALWMQHEIIKAKNRDDSIMLAVASLGLPREAIEILELYSSKTGKYALNSLTLLEYIREPDKYFLTSKKGVYLDRFMLEGLDIDSHQAQEAVKNVLSENVIPIWMDLLILQKIDIDRSVTKVVSNVKSYNKFVI